MILLRSQRVYRGEGGTMKKSLHIIVSGMDSPQRFAEALKIRVHSGEAEGVVLIASPHSVEIDVRGEKDQVDDFLGVLEAVVFFEKRQTGRQIFIEATPLIPQEDYRGVFRFLLQRR